MPICGLNSGRIFVFCSTWASFQLFCLPLDVWCNVLHCSDIMTDVLWFFLERTCKEETYKHINKKTNEERPGTDTLLSFLSFYGVSLSPAMWQWSILGLYIFHVDRPVKIPIRGSEFHPMLLLLNSKTMEALNFGDNQAFFPRYCHTFLCDHKLKAWFKIAKYM